MMSHELHLEPVEESEPRRSFLVVLTSTVFGSFIPRYPTSCWARICPARVRLGAVTVSGIVLFVIGYYEARTTVGSLWKSGLQMVLGDWTGSWVGWFPDRTFHRCLTGLALPKQQERLNTILKLMLVLCWFYHIRYRPVLLQSRLGSVSLEDGPMLFAYASRTFGNKYRAFPLHRSNTSKPAQTRTRSLS